MIKIIFAGYPITDPFSTANLGKNQPYNLIDTDPSCYYEDICPMFPPGGELSVFPNSEEKYQQLLHNIHRMFTNCSLTLPLCKWLYGANTQGGLTVYCNAGCIYCGDKDSKSRDPLYWYSDANQMARFKQWDEQNCDQSWYNDKTQHVTCKLGVGSMSYWGKGGITSNVPKDRCSILGSTGDNCQFGTRAGRFCHDDKDRCWFETEGICGGNSCLNDPHCEPVFASKYDYVGKGFVSQMNGVAAVYSRFTKEIFYKLPVGAHFDERIVLVPEDHNIDGKYFNLMLEYHDPNRTETPSICYAVYDNDYHELDVYVSPAMDTKCNIPNIFTKNHYSVIFYKQFLPHIKCKPYSFICKTSQNKLIRLPEERKYYFGTQWIDWVWSDYSSYGYNECKEQHYYDHPLQGWTVNGGPTLTKPEIWYYAQYGGTCDGCIDIPILQCLENCIYSNDLTQLCKSLCVSQDTLTPTTNTISPTKNPAVTPVKSPTKSPIKSPTKSPIKSPTKSPIKSPTKSPIKLPTKSPTEPPIKSPTKSPTKSPIKTPTQGTTNPTELPTTSPTIITLNPSKLPTIFSNNPTMSPTIISVSPTEAPIQTGETCHPIIDWFYRWSRIGSWDEAKYGALYQSVAEEIFITEHEGLECGEFNNENSFEYYYYFYWGGRDRPNRRKLWIYMHVCCGRGNTFGPHYQMPPGLEENGNYAANSVWRGKYVAPYEEKNEWTNPSSFGIKQYIVFSICGVLIICCCIGLIFIFKCKYNKTKKQRVEGNTTDNKKRNLAQTIQMHGLSSYPGPKHVHLPKHVQLPSTDGSRSTDGNNTFQLKYIHPQNDSTDGSQADNNINNNNISTLVPPPMHAMGGYHVPMASKSIDTPELAAVVQNMDLGDDLNLNEDNIKQTGLPPPMLDDEDIADAFDIDI